METLNSDQKHAYDSVLSDPRDGVLPNRVVLIGPGGTGKSFLVASVIQDMMSWVQIAIVADVSY